VGVLLLDDVEGHGLRIIDADRIEVDSLARSEVSRGVPQSAAHYFCGFKHRITVF
jgi:hypothetical protein